MKLLEIFDSKQNYYSDRIFRPPAKKEPSELKWGQRADYAKFKIDDNTYGIRIDKMMSNPNTFHIEFHAFTDEDKPTTDITRTGKSISVFGGVIQYVLEFAKNNNARCIYFTNEGYFGNRASLYEKISKMLEQKYNWKYSQQHRQGKGESRFVRHVLIKPGSSERDIERLSGFFQSRTLNF